MDAALIRESAVEAGIDAKYVDRALVERASMAASVIEPGELMQKSANPFVGARTKVEYVGMIDGEMTGDDFEEIADEVRRALGEVVNVSAVVRTLTINSSIGASRQGGVVRAVQMNVTSRNSRTQFRIYEDLSQTAVSCMVGLGVSAGTSLSALLGVHDGEPDTQSADCDRRGGVDGDVECRHRVFLVYAKCEETRRAVAGCAAAGGGESANADG